MVDAPWKTLFLGCAHTGTDLLDAWETGNNAVTAFGVVEDIGVECSQHSRASLVGRWRDLRVEKVSMDCLPSCPNSRWNCDWLVFFVVGKNEKKK